MGLYQALSTEHTWLVVTSHRLAVLRLRDRAEGTASEDALAEVKEEKSIGGALRGLGKLVSASAAEFAKSVRRPPLAERPDDAVLECPYELPRAALARVEKGKQRLVPQFRGGSLARVKTDEPGQAALTGSAD